MGYDLHITRRIHWGEEQPESDITLAEWLEYIENDDELIVSSELKIGDLNADGMLEPRLGFCDWVNHPNKEKRWFDFFDGDINTKFPDDFTIMKMLKIAKILNANLQGDDGEHYSLNESGKVIYFHPINENDLVEKKQKKAWWKFW